MSEIKEYGTHLRVVQSGAAVGRFPVLRFSVPQDVEANTVRLEEHGKTVLVLEKSAESEGQGGAGTSSK